MPFHPGHSGNPNGRPKGSISGRSLALAALDELLSEQSTQAQLKEALEKSLRENPVKFFKEIVMPLLPRHAVLDLAPQGPIQWRGLLDSPEPDPSETAVMFTAAADRRR